MIKFKGTTLYPASVFDILDNTDYVENYLVEVSTNEIGMDHLTVFVGVKLEKEEYIKELKDRFRAKLRVAPEVRFKPIDEIQRIQMPEIKRKPVKFIDNRV